MPLLSGTLLGPYEILELVGVGGMGEVYRARDSRLDRVVAIKTLAPVLASRDDMRQRFEAEARAIAGLTHPNICAIFDVGTAVVSDRWTTLLVDYLVMEYIEGETLLRRLERGPLPLDELLGTAIEVADALAWAHRRDLVHRDLKPANVMLLRSGRARTSGGARQSDRASGAGRVKLLDFGLAKLSEPQLRFGAKSEGRSQAPTRPGEPLTAEGTLLGTLEYMSPEQLEGRQADARSDIFAFGLLLYELATGERPFAGANPASLIAAVMIREPPPFSSYDRHLPPALEQVVRRCLVKDPDERWQSAWDIARALEAVRLTFDTPPSRPARAAVRRRSLLLAAVGGGLLASLLAALVFTRPTARGPQLAVAVTLPAGDALELFTGPSIAISPDGRRLAYVAYHAGVRQIFVRELDELNATPLAGSAGGQAPFFSPDGRELGFFTGGKLVKCALGGPVVQLADAPTNRGGAWGIDGTIYFAPTPAGGIWTVPAVGGTAAALTEPNRAGGENSHRWPALVTRSGRDLALLYTVRSDRIESFDQAKVVARDLASGREKQLIDGGTSGRFIAPDRLVFARGGNLYAQQLDPSNLILSGTPERWIGGVSTNPTSGAAMYGLTNSGNVAYLPGGVEAFNHQLAWIGRGGTARDQHDLGRRASSGVLSPDGRYLAARVPAANDDLWLFDLERHTFLRLTSEAGDEHQPTYSPDGKAIAFSAERAGKRTLFVVPADGSASPRLLLPAGPDRRPETYTVDGSALIYTETSPATGDDLWLLPTPPTDQATTPAPQPLLVTQFAENNARLSPDGRWLAYTSNESGRDEVYLQPFPGSGKLRVSTGGGTAPRFAPGGEALFFRADDTTWRVALEVDPRTQRLTPGTLDAWFSGPYSEPFAVSADGLEVLAVRSPSEAPRTVIELRLTSGV